MGQDSGPGWRAFTIQRGGEMMRASGVSLWFESPSWLRLLRASVLVLVLASLLQAGCGWIFGKRKKPMEVKIELTATDSLNFDGVQAQAVRARVYILKDAANFMSGDIRAICVDDWNPEWREMVFHKRDTLGLRTIDIAPGETRTAKIVIPHGVAKREKPVFAVIADFLYPPADKSERLAFELKKKWNQTVKITVGKNWVAKTGKKK